MSYSIHKETTPTTWGKWWEKGILYRNTCLYCGISCNNTFTRYRYLSGSKKKSLASLDRPGPANCIRKKNFSNLD